VDPRSREALAAWGVRSLPPMLLNEVQKQQRTIGTLRAQVAAADEQTRARDEQVRTLTEQMAALTRAVAALSDRKQSRGWRRRIRVPGRRRSPVGRPPRRVLGLEGSSPQYGAGQPSHTLACPAVVSARRAISASARRSQATQYSAVARADRSAAMTARRLQGLPSLARASLRPHRTRSLRSRATLTTRCAFPRIAPRLPHGGLRARDCFQP
jgi:hypothetical protein